MGGIRTGKVHKKVPLSCPVLNSSVVLPTGPTASELVTGEVGQNVTVPCSYSVRRTSDITSMCWGRDSCPQSRCSRPIIWTDGWRVTEQHGSRYLLQGNLWEGDVSLTIVDAKEADSGTYCCRVEHRGWFNDQKSNFEVVIRKAPGSTSESSFTFTETWPASASEAPRNNTSVSLPSQQYSENGLYIGIGSCAVLLVILILALFLTKPHTASQTVVRGVTGQSVRLPCNYRVTPRTGVSDVCWGRGSCPNSKCKNTILETRGSRVKFRKSWRYDLQGSISTGDVSLTIGMVDAGDAGLYCCRVEIPGLFNDIKKNIQLVVARAPPVMTTTTRKAPVSPEGFRKTTFAPQATSVLQPTAQTAVLLTTTTTNSPDVTTLETIAPPTIPVTEKDTFPVTMVTSSALPHSSTISHEDDMFCVTEPGPIPGSTQVTTEFPNILLTEEGSTSADTSVMIEDVPNAVISANSDGKAEQHDDSGDKFPGSVILIACVIAGTVLSVLMFSLFWKHMTADGKIELQRLSRETSGEIRKGCKGDADLLTSSRINAAYPSDDGGPSQEFSSWLAPGKSFSMFGLGSSLCVL
ncbi:T-cell immunoglobulin and mucin domain-containing protein 4-like [Pitangus sulphuratus]|nr:T-cell immunoglobulin and mucin domain-containing protein 4-like [Pitangus sulphuratus]